MSTITKPLFAKGVQSQIRHKALTLLELLTVVSIIAALAALLLAQIARSKEYARRTECRNNLRQLGMSLMLYADNYHNLLPDCTTNNPDFFGTWWPWDLNTNLVSDLISYGAVRRTLYCPSNPGMNDEKHWDLWKYYPSRPIRVAGFVFLLNGGIEIPTNLWRIRLSGDAVLAPTETELVLDATVSQYGNFKHVKGVWTDRTSHLDGSKPAGGNILCEDGHVVWRQFSKMRVRINAEAQWEF